MNYDSKDELNQINGHALIVVVVAVVGKSSNALLFRPFECMYFNYVLTTTKEQKKRQQGTVSPQNERALPYHYSIYMYVCVYIMQLLNT